ncbi:phage terminase large subunit family protein [Puniceicoccaceae bacterium K14]|nr:phage terminase large subunit family protein [Puniceicoccaceae bacterium K14]
MFIEEITEEFVIESLAEIIPDLQGLNMVDWCEENVVLEGSVISEKFRIDFTPWLRKAYEALDHPDVDSVTLVMCAQSGKSTWGENAICYLICTKPKGDIQYNWESDKKGEQRLKKRVFPIFKATPAVALKLPKGAGPSNPVIRFPHLSFTMQGVAVAENVESDSITFQFNEELHSWKLGRKKLADARQDMVEFPFQGNISTGGIIGDQLHLQWQKTSQEKYEEPCDSCGHYQYFRMQTFDEKLGGLKYETIKKPDGTYDFDAIEPTIHYECEECGHKMFDDKILRRQRSLKGRYPNPNFSKHIGLHVGGLSIPRRSYRKMLENRLLALTALRNGDSKPWIQYIQRDEGFFYDPRKRPLADALKRNKEFRMGEGLKDRKARFMTVDKQAGSLEKGELSHYWVIIRDWASASRSRLVYAGKVVFNEDVENLRKEFNVQSRFVLVDSGDDTKRVYQMCGDYGYTAIKGEGRLLWTHRLNDKNRTKVERIYSPIQNTDVYKGTKNSGRVFVDRIHYSKHSIRDALNDVRTGSHCNWEVPEDVPEFYKEHMSTESLEAQVQSDGTTRMIWKQIPGSRNDLFVCECYQMILVDLTNLKDEELPPIHTEQNED